MDRKWWTEYGPECSFEGERYAGPEGVADGVKWLPFEDVGGNSGAAAILLAKWFGASRVVLLGYDCKPDKNGKRHFHGAHTRRRERLTDAGSMDSWPAQFERVSSRVGGVEVLNATRDTALKCWPLVDLEEALC